MFISYAQNFEDVILNRIFKDRQSGFYIDIGAHHPISDSVTKAFYDRGWNGINIEPIKKFYDFLEEDRTRDINLNFAMGEKESELEFFQLEETGLSTFDPETANRLAEENNYQITKLLIPVKTLSNICRQYVKCSIDFLKIDVEGWEEKVILGHDWEQFRPKVVIIEATIPNSPVRVQTNIRTILEDKNYTHIYFDGLNDYYIAKEESDLSKYFTTPPNVFDKFIRFSLYKLRLHSQNQKEIIEAKEIQINNHREQLEEMSLQKNITNNRFKDLEFEIDRLNKVLENLNKKYLEEKLKSDRDKNSILLLESELAQTNELVTAMESSKFWKLRNTWFKIKNKFNLLHKS